MMSRMALLGLLLLMGASKPVVRFDPAPVPYEQRSKPQDFDVQVRFGTLPTTRVGVELTLDNGRGEPRSFTAMPTATPDLWHVAATLIPEYLHPLRLRLLAHFSSGDVTCSVEDDDIEIGKQTIALRDVRGGSGGQLLHLQLKDGTTIETKPNVLTNLRGDLGPTAITLNLALADSFTVEVIHPSLAKVDYTLKVTEADAKVTEQSGEIPITGTPPTTEPASEPTSAREPVSK